LKKDCDNEQTALLPSTEGALRRVIGFATTAEVDETLKRINHALAGK